MKKQYLVSFLLLFIGALSIQAADVIPVADYNVVPLPKVVTPQKGKAFVLDSTVQVVYDVQGINNMNEKNVMHRYADFLVDWINKNTGITLPVYNVVKTLNHSIMLKIDSKVAGNEAYNITVNRKQVVISGSTLAGIFYGIQTLRKSLPIAKNANTVTFPAVEIKDAPRFAYRGMMLDCARHFFPVDVIKEFIDVLALHNINTFHWHLTDDQGWRIEIKKYPELTDKSSVRQRTVIGRNSPVYDNTPYGGYYTQEQALDIVHYASERNITVIPEVDMPGHMLATLYAHPELGCTGGPYEVCPNWGVFDDILCAGNDATFTFVNNVLDELIDIFPSKYIHIGGDEAPKVRWKNCVKCQQRIKDEGIIGDSVTSAEDKLQGYFMTRVEKHINNKGRKMIGWDEVLEGNVDRSATIMAWRGWLGADHITKAANLGHDVIMTPTDYSYFDYYQTKETFNEPLFIGGYVPISKVYSYEPIPDSLSTTAKQHVIGLQANLWTEYVTSKELIEYEVLPRLAALCETQWVAPIQKDFDKFKVRLHHLMDLYKLYGLNNATKVE